MVDYSASISNAFPSSVSLIILTALWVPSSSSISAGILSINGWATFSSPTFIVCLWKAAVTIPFTLLIPNPVPSAISAAVRFFDSFSFT